MVFCSGPAGTGKTFIAVAVGLQLLEEDKIGKIVITRPAVEAGEKLGHLPGDLNEKVLPYLMPILDSIDQLIGPKETKKLMANHLVEISPIAFMRGRTFLDSLIILDEAQNTTETQMLMVLSRMGLGSKMVITGDEDQSDLRHTNGLADAILRLSHIDEISFVELFETCRHPIINKIVRAYGNVQQM